MVALASLLFLIVMILLIVSHLVVPLLVVVAVSVGVVAFHLLDIAGYSLGMYVLFIQSLN